MYKYFFDVLKRYNVDVPDWKETERLRSLTEYFHITDVSLLELIYRHLVMGLILSEDSIPIVCKKGRLDLLKYIHVDMGFTTKHARCRNNLALTFACGEGHLDIVKYLHLSMGITSYDIQSRNSEPLRVACVKKHFHIADYLYQIGLDSKDIDYYTSCKHFFKEDICYNCVLSI